MEPITEEEAGQAGVVEAALGVGVQEAEVSEDLAGEVLVAGGQEGSGSENIICKFVI